MSKVAGLALIGALVLTGCAPTVGSEAMLPGELALASKSSARYRNIRVGGVDAGPAKAFIQRSPVDDKQIRDALTLALGKADLLGPPTARFVISFKLLSLESDTVGFSLDANGRATYMIEDSASDRPGVWREIACTAQVGAGQHALNFQLRSQLLHSRCMQQLIGHAVAAATARP